MQLIATLVQVLPPQSGPSKTGNGEWKKQDFIVETQGAYPKKISISTWGDRIPNEAVLKPGNLLKIEFDIESREFNGRWYTDVKAWKVEIEGESNQLPGSEANENIPVIDINDAGASEGESDDLPF